MINNDNKISIKEVRSRISEIISKMSEAESRKPLKGLENGVTLEHLFDLSLDMLCIADTNTYFPVCHGIIKDHEGTITVKNSPEGGAVFTIKLPVG